MISCISFAKIHRCFLESQRNKHNAQNFDFEAIATLLNKMVQDLFSSANWTPQDLSMNPALCPEIGFCLAHLASWQNCWGIVWECGREGTNDKENGRLHTTVQTHVLPFFELAL